MLGRDLGALPARGEPRAAWVAELRRNLDPAREP